MIGVHKVGESLRVSLSGGRIVEATVKAIHETMEGLRLQVSFGDETALIYLWQSSRRFDRGLQPSVPPLFPVGWEEKAILPEISANGCRTHVHPIHNHVPLGFAWHLLGGGHCCAAGLLQTLLCVLPVPGCDKR